MKELIRAVTRAIVLTLMVGGALSDRAIAAPGQDRQVEEKPKQEGTPPQPPTTAAQLVNIRVDVTLTQSGPEPSRKVVSMTTGDGGRGSVRSFNTAFMPLTAPAQAATPRPNNMINVDVRPHLERDGRVRANIVIEYRGGLSLAFDPLLESGKPLLVSQAPDPNSDAITTVEVMATVLK